MPVARDAAIDGFGGLGGNGGSPASVMTDRAGLPVGSTRKSKVEGASTVRRKAGMIPGSPTAPRRLRPAPIPYRARQEAGNENCFDDLIPRIGEPQASGVT